MFELQLQLFFLLPTSAFILFYFFFKPLMPLTHKGLLGVKEYEKKKKKLLRSENNKRTVIMKTEDND